MTDTKDQTKKPTYTVPKIYAAYHKILEELQVDKTSDLPTNMGGKKAFAADQVAADVKSLLVENNLIFRVLSEDVVSNEVIPVGNRLNIVITVQGTYELIHIEDGSSITIGGVGQGVAIGSSVAASIAGTFALKSGLLHSFLITEESVEREGLAPTQPKESAALKKAQSDKDGSSGLVGTMGDGKISTSPTLSINKIKAKIATHFESPLKIRESGAEYFKNYDGGWAKASQDVAALSKWSDSLEKK